MSEQVRYLKQTVDYLGTLQTKLRDLRGTATLSYELIQNADDVRDDRGQPGASRITFDVCDDALIVENDGVFREVDFQRMQNIASGGKREEAETTGAFGVGFISVYQITDSPEIFSSGRHWRIRPEAPDDERIEERSTDVDGTRFLFPWAFDARSEVRRKLRVEPVRSEQLPQFVDETAEAISRASLFLKQLRVLEVKRSGDLVKRVERLEAGEDRILVGEGGQSCCWNILRGSFHDEAVRLRAQHSLQIEQKRRSDVLVAIPDEPLDLGRLYAVLPSETTIPLPFHINADFYPSSDRKRIIFDRDYQSDWNRAAVLAAARTLAANLDRLPELLGHRALWRLLDALNECRRAAQQGKHDAAFAAFWDAISASLAERRIVYTTSGQWVKPREARQLERDAELEASEILEELGIQIAHPDLRPFFGLLRQIGAPLLSVQDVSEALGRAGLDKETPLSRAPKRLRKVESWQALWRTLDVLLDERQLSADQNQRAEQLLRSCAIALDEKSVLRPPAELFRGDAKTRSLFPGIPWLGKHAEPGKVPERLVCEFTAEWAVELLSRPSVEQLKNAYREGRLDLKALYQWFESRRAEILPNLQLKTRLRNLPIWPAADGLHPLAGLYIPGGFDDPFRLSMLVDLAALGGRKDFLKDLGVEELTFSVYAREQVPRFLTERSELPPKARRDLVQLLAQRLGEIRDDRDLHARLRSLNLVECTDGLFRPAHQVYMRSDVMHVLGDRVHIAAQMQQNIESVSALYRWLGAATEPRPGDVLGRVQELGRGAVTDQARKAVEAIFGYLTDRWAAWDNTQQQAYEHLQSTAWLPATGDRSHWHKPRELFAVFQSYLFETQARFLDLPRQVQNQAGRVGLIGFLGIEETPTPTRVVRHLLTCSERDQEVNREVYRFLNENADHQAVGELKGKPCLLLPNGKYVRPDQVYWGEHPFGPLRNQLGAELRRYDALLRRLEVQESPQDQDYIQVLTEIGEQYGKAHQTLDDDIYAVLMRCWKALSTALEEGRLEAKDLAKLSQCEVIPDPRQVLILPGYMFFEDRAGLTAKFGTFLEHNVIPRPQGAWRGMEAVGVQSLGQAVQVHLLECGDPTDDVDLISRLAERRQLLERVVDSERATGVEGADATVLDSLRIQRVNRLTIQYSLEAFRKDTETEPESAPALWLPRQSTLYVARANGQISWPAVARELAQAIKPIGEIGGLAGGITHALSSNSLAESQMMLDQLGYPPLQQIEVAAIAGPGPVTGWGGVEGPTEGGEDERPRAQPADGQADGQMTAQVAVAGILGDEGGPRTPPPETPAETLTGVSTSGKPHAARKYKPKGKLRTYVLPDDVELPDHPDGVGAGQRSEVDQAGIHHVLEYERACGRTPTEMPHQHEGYDIESADVQGHIERLIEVKSLFGQWCEPSPAALTQAEFGTARSEGQRIWLYVVERATSEDYRLHRIQDPANRVDQYLFDDGWQAVAENSPETVRG